MFRKILIANRGDRAALGREPLNAWRVAPGQSSREVTMFRKILIANRGDRAALGCESLTEGRVAPGNRAAR